MRINPQSLENFVDDNTESLLKVILEEKLLMAYIFVLLDNIRASSLIPDVKVLKQCFRQNIILVGWFKMYVTYLLNIANVETTPCGDQILPLAMNFFNWDKISETILERYKIHGKQKKDLA